MLTSVPAEYFIWHEGNHLVLTRSKSLLCAHAVAEGILNTTVEVHFGQLSLIMSDQANVKPDQVFAFDRIYRKVYAYDGKVSAEDQDLINLAELRQKFLLKLELQLDRYRRRNYHTYDSGFYHWVDHAIKNSNPDLGEFSSEIKEFSDITGLDPLSTYYDFKMKHDSFSLINIKMWAYYEKFKRQMNQCYTETEMQETFDRCFREAFFASTI